MLPRLWGTSDPQFYVYPFHSAVMHLAWHTRAQEREHPPPPRSGLRHRVADIFAFLPHSPRSNRFCVRHPTLDMRHDNSQKREPHRRFSTSSTRATKRAALLSTLETGVRELYARQLGMLCARALKSYKAALVRLLDGDMLGEESEANVLRQVCRVVVVDACAGGFCVALVCGGGVFLVVVAVVGGGSDVVFLVCTQGGQAVACFVSGVCGRYRR